jgi:hypothetical protein
MNQARVGSALSPEQFFLGFLAAVALEKRVLQGTRTDLHQAFYEAVSKAEENSFIRAEDLDIDFDPLYEVSPWFDQALTRAQRDLIVSFPNPSYERIQISFDSQEASGILDKIGFRPQFEAMAHSFLNNLHF